MENKYYLHINSVNLPHYWGCACIKPNKYFDDVRSEDIQSKFSDYLLLSSKKRTKNADCAVELILTDEEQDKLIKVPPSNGIYLSPFPLPITRVSSIYFENEEQKDKIVTLINLSTAFLPKSLAKLFREEEYIEYSEITLPDNVKTPDYSESLKKYNSLLGGFALMKLARESYMNYSENYFSTLAFFNSVIERELTLARKVNTIYYDVFIGKDSFKSLIPYLTKGIIEEDLNSVARAENQKIKKDVITGIIDLNALEKATYIIAVLYSYGLGEEGRKNKIDGLILNNFHKNIKTDKAEVIALCYGLNRGYSAFSNKYKNENSEQLVKFEMNSKVDYYTIESIYQSAINNVIKSHSFPYLDSWCPKYEGLIRKQSKNDYFILDKVIIAERIKIGDQKWWLKFMNIFFQKNSEDLFKPFLLSAFNKIKEDLEEEFKNEIENKNSELKALKKEKDELIQKIKDAEKKENKSQKGKYKDSESKNIESIVEEAKVEYHAKNNLESTTIATLRKTLEDHNKLLKKLSKETKMAEAKKMIVDFNKKISTSDLFNDGAK